MKTRCATGLVALLALAMAAPVVLAGAADLTAQNKLLAMRAAQVDALRKLAEQVYGLKIDSETSVKDFVAESDVIKTQVKAFLRGAKMVGQPRYYADGACDVDYEMTLETVITELKRIADGYVSKSGKFTGKVFEQIKQNTKLTTIRVTGSGAPRTAAADDPALAADAVMEGIAIACPQEKITVRAIPLGWENVTAQGRLMAMRAAQADAYRQIAEQVKGLKIDSQTTVRDFVAESDDIRTRVDTFIMGIKTTGQRYMSDQIAECDAEITLQEVVENLKKIADGTVKHGKFTGTVIEQITKSVTFKTIKVTGRGVPPARYMTAPVGPVVVGPGPVTPEVPAWATQFLKATGSAAVDQAMLKENQAQAWLNAERAAQVDAMRKLAEQVNGVQIDAKTVVKDFVAQFDAIKADMSTFMTGARVAATRRNEDGTAECDVELPLERLWVIVQKARAGAPK